MKSSVNLEYSHFYISEGIGMEQRASMLLAEEILASCSDEVTLSVLVDDRPLQSVTWLMNSLRKALSLGLRQPDWIVRESGLCLAADTLVSRIEPAQMHVRQSYDGYMCHDLETAGSRIRLWKQIKNTRHYSCACLSAAWLLCRLGEIALPRDAVLSTSTKPFVAEQALSVLHQRYQSVERRAQEIILAGGFSAALKRIRYQYYQ